MRAGLAISGVAHVVLLTWSTLVFPSAEVFEVEPVQSLPVEIITPSELTRILAGAKDAEPPEPETAPVAASEPDPQPQQTAALQPDTQPAPEAEPAPVAAEPEPEPEPEPVAEPTPPEPQRVEINRNAMRVPTFRPRHSEPNRQQFDADRIAALLDKAPDQEQTRRQNDSQSEQPATRGQSDGRDSNMSISEIDLLRRQISRCWNPPIGVQGAENLIVAIRISLRRDGTLSGTPEVDGAISGVTERVAAESALRAVRRCAPYQLPPEKYDTWRDIRVTFDPRQMLGG